MKRRSLPPVRFLTRCEIGGIIMGVLIDGEQVREDSLIGRVQDANNQHLEYLNNEFKTKFGYAPYNRDILAELRTMVKRGVACQQQDVHGNTVYCLTSEGQESYLKVGGTD